MFDTMQEGGLLRKLLIMNPQNYSGQLSLSGLTQQSNADRVFFVNGLIDKCDGNFL